MNSVCLACRSKEAAKALGISLAAFHDLQNPRSPRFDPRFPAKVRLGPRTVVYTWAELSAYLESRKANSHPIGRAEQ